MTLLRAIYVMVGINMVENSAFALALTINCDSFLALAKLMFMVSGLRLPTTNTGFIDLDFSAFDWFGKFDLRSENDAITRLRVGQPVTLANYCC